MIKTSLVYVNTTIDKRLERDAFTGLLEQHGTRISMDEKGSYNDNLSTERLWRTIRYENVIIRAYTQVFCDREVCSPGLLDTGMYHRISVY